MISMINTTLEELEIPCIGLVHRFVGNYLEDYGISLISVKQDGKDIKLLTDINIPKENLSYIRDVLYTFSCTEMSDKVPEPTADINPVIASLTYDPHNKTVLASTNISGVSSYKSKGITLHFVAPIGIGYGIIGQQHIINQRSYPLKIIKKTENSLTVYPTKNINKWRENLFTILVTGDGASEYE
jgi:hypothetical protein